MHVIANVKGRVLKTSLNIVGVLVGIVLLCTGLLMVYMWAVAPLPSEQSVRLHVTLQAKIIPGYSFDPGYPNVGISMDEFRERSASAPFIVSYSKKWETGEKWSEGRDLYREQTIYYIMKSPDADIYLTSSERAPVFRALGYEFETKFNPKDRTFFSVVTGTSYGELMVSMIVLFVGLLLAGLCGWYLADLFKPNKKRFFY